MTNQPTENQPTPAAAGADIPLSTLIESNPEVAQFVVNSLLLQRYQTGQLAGLSFDGARDLYKVLGYNRTPTYDDYFAVYDRGDLGARLIDMPPESTWKNPPVVKDGTREDGGNASTEFAQKFAELADRVRLWHYLERVDRVGGIGRYGILFLGFNQGKFVEEVKAGQFESSGVNGLAYLSVYDEKSADIVSLVGELESEINDPRYGQPKFYSLQSGETTDRRTLPKRKAHWTRIIHIAENLLLDEVYGRPRLRNPLNRLSDLEKVTGGSAEAIWRLIYKGLMVSSKDGYGLPTGEALQTLKDNLDNFMHGLQRHILGEGVEFNSEGGEVIDPTGMFQILVRLISGKIPWQMLIGAERGDVANKQDQETWAGEIASRQTKHAGPDMLRPFIDRMIFAGVLPKPSMGKYFIEWPPLYPPDPIEMAEINAKRAETMSKALDALLQGTITLPEFRKISGLPDKPEDGGALAFLQMEDMSNPANLGGA